LREADGMTAALPPGGSGDKRDLALHASRHWLSSYFLFGHYCAQ
jgi:hypothetical protein